MFVRDEVTIPGRSEASGFDYQPVYGETADFEYASEMRRRDLILEELDGLPVVIPGGGWSLLLEAALGIEAPVMSQRLLEKGRIAATPMTAWGEEIAPRYVRLVYSNEPLDRLEGIGARVQSAL